MMPWDQDTSVEIEEEKMQHLADYYNMTVHHFKPAESNKSRDYLLETISNWAKPSTAGVESKIHGRWVGYYYDVLSIRGYPFAVRRASQMERLARSNDV